MNTPRIEASVDPRDFLTKSGRVAWGLISLEFFSQCKRQVKQIDPNYIVGTGKLYAKMRPLREYAIDELRKHYYKTHDLYIITISFEWFGSEDRIC